MSAFLSNTMLDIIIFFIIHLEFCELVYHLMDSKVKKKVILVYLLLLEISLHDIKKATLVEPTLTKQLQQLSKPLLTIFGEYIF